MSVSIQAINKYCSSVALGTTETELVSLTPTTTAIVEGYIDLSNVPVPVIIREYISVDGTTYNKFLEYDANPNDPVLVVRLHSKILASGMGYKVTIVATTTPSTTVSVPYCFIVFVLSQ